MTKATETAAGGDADLREAIARIVDPDYFRAPSSHSAASSPLAKADAILALVEPEQRLMKDAIKDCWDALGDYELDLQEDGADDKASEIGSLRARVLDLAEPIAERQSLSTQSTRIAALEEGLEPFVAPFEDVCASDVKDAAHMRPTWCLAQDESSFTLGDLRRARTLVAGKEAPK
jgi:hypothetical protein